MISVNSLLFSDIKLLLEFTYLTKQQLTTNSIHSNIYIITLLQCYFIR